MDPALCNLPWPVHRRHLRFGYTGSQRPITKIKTEWGLTLPKLLLAKSDEEFDKILSEFTAKRDEYGFDLVKAETIRQIQVNIEKLGLNK